jgi:integrase
LPAVGDQWQGAPVADPVRPDILRPADVTRLLQGCGPTPAGLRLAALAATLHGACPRIGVALALEAGDVDLTAASIRLRGRREWEVALDDVPLARLARWIACRTSHGIGSGPLFCTLDRAPLDHSYVRRELAALGRRAGVRIPVSAEALRRAGVARLIAAGVGDARLQEYLDHGRAGVPRGTGVAWRRAAGQRRGRRAPLST